MKCFFLCGASMLHTDWHLGKQVRVFVQLKSGLELFRQGGPRPIDEKKLDFEAAYVEVGDSDKKNWIVLRVGRQELNYGSGRLVSVREGPNVRQSFDGFKVRGKAGAWNIDAFAVRPDLDKIGFSTTHLTIKRRSGGFMPRGLGIEAFLSTPIIWGKIAKARHSIGERPRNFGTAWQRGSRVPLRLGNAVWISMMKRFGNLEPSAPPPFVPGPSPQIMATVFPICH